MKSILICCFYLVPSLTVQAQDKKSSVSFQLSGTLTTTPVYAIQATDTAFNQSFVTVPAAKCIIAPGFTLQYSPYFVSGGSAPGLYMHIVTAGYEQYEKPTLNIDTYYAHYFFTGNKSVPYSPITNEVYLSLNYKKLWLAPLISSSIAFGKDQNNMMQTAVNIAGGFLHSFELKSTRLSYGEISPAIALNMGVNPAYSFLTTTRYVTQNNAILKANKGKGRGNGNSGGTTITSSATTAVNTFGANNIEMNLYSSFQKGHFEVIPSGSLFIPLKTGETLSGYWQLKFACNL